MSKLYEQLLNKPFERIQIAGGQTQGFVKASGPLRTNVLRKRGLGGDDYAYQIRHEEELQCSQQQKAPELEVNDLTTVDDLTSIGTIPNVNELEREELVQVYNTYNFERKERSRRMAKLPIFEHEELVLNMINSYKVCIIKGKTGCGKTTQIPQMILDSFCKERKHCNIVVTQPRRIAAISVAKRVSEERNWPLGTIVGYQVGLERVAGVDTRLTYCTTGVLLEKLIGSKTLNDYTHVIIDEVHERDTDTDFLMLLVRKLQRTVSPFVKIILMSATIEKTAFVEYFSAPPVSAAPFVEITEKTNYDVTISYVNQLEMKLGPYPDVTETKPCIDKSAYIYAVKIIEAFDKIDEYENEQLKCSVLVFLPGMMEIELLYEALQERKNQLREEVKWWICPLHSTITAEEQMMVFKTPMPGHRKIILSTNIAESSLTVADIKYVIDFCLTKVMQANPETNLSSLHLAWASKNQCDQRSGRVGRVRTGRVYRMVPQSFYATFDEEGRPEILRSPLEIVVLRAKRLEMGEPKHVLALAMDPPDLNRIEQTILSLKEVGALLLTVNGKYHVHDGDLTPLGQIMARLPLDIRMSKLIMLGHTFSVLEESIIMACAMTVKSMFSKPFKQEVQAYISKLTWADSTCSDSIACLNAYKLWRISKTTGKFDRSTGGGATAWGKRFLIQLRAMTEIARLEEEVTQRLRHSNIEEPKGRNRVKWDKYTKPLILKVVLAGAFYPHYFVRSQSGGQVNESEAVKILGGRDPFSTVYLSNFPMNQPGPLYTNFIKEHFINCGVQSKHVKVSFDSASTSKVYVEFKTSPIDNTVVEDREFNYSIPGKISMAVYRAIKMRHYNSSSVNILVLPPDEARKQVNKMIQQREEKQRQGVMEKATDKVSVLPVLSKSFLEIHVVHVNNLGNFYAINSEHISRLQIIAQLLNEPKVLYPLKSVPQINAIYAAPFKDGEGSSAYYRAQLIDYEKNQARVFFVDYGNVDIVALSALREFDPIQRSGLDMINLLNEPFLAFNCTLARIQPSCIKDHHEMWSEDAVKLFKTSCLDKRLMALVYSVVDNVVAVEIFLRDPSNFFKSKNDAGDSFDTREMPTVNKLLVDKHYAEWNEESYLSKLDHEIRKSRQTNPKDEYFDEYSDETSSRSSFISDYDENIPTLRREHLRKPVKLRGPDSPLEMTVYSNVQSNIMRQITIEQDSVNSVLLDTHPHDPHERMLVAGCVNQSANGERLILRYTTMMPNIHGLSALICLLFTPCAEFRINEAHTRFTGALCGLGCDPDTKESYFPENDMEIKFDTSFTLDNIQTINRLRFWMSVFLSSNEYNDPFQRQMHEIVEHQHKVESMFLSLLEALGNQRPERQEQACTAFVWGQVDDDLILSPQKSDDHSWQVYRLHFGVSLEADPEIVEPDRRLVKNLIELKEISDGMRTIKGAMCYLCQVSLDDVRSLKFHLVSTHHVELCKRYHLHNISYDTSSIY